MTRKNPGHSGKTLLILEKPWSFWKNPGHSGKKTWSFWKNPGRSGKTLVILEKKLVILAEIT